MEYVVIIIKHIDHNYKGGKRTTVDEFKRLGITILTPFNTQIGKKYKLGIFTIIPLPAIHNVECRTFLIQVDNNNILFATDTNALPKINIKIDYFIVEVNFLEKMREQAVLQDNANFLHLNGVFHNHHSLESAIEYFKDLDYKAKKIITIHSSNSGIFSKQETIEKLSPFADYVDVAKNNTNYILEEI